MNRRDALKATAAFLGTSIVGAQAFLHGCQPPEKKIGAFDADTIALLDAIGETIIPETPNSPGARAANIGAFMKVIVTDCYSAEEQTNFFEGLTRLEADVREKFGASFVELSNTDQLAFVTELDRASQSQESKDQPHIFDMLHQLTVWGYFTSEPGATKALRFIPVPGSYQGCVPLGNDEGAWLY